LSFIFHSGIHIEIYKKSVYNPSCPVDIQEAVILQIESTVTPSGNSSHLVVWIGKEAIVTLKVKRNRSKSNDEVLCSSPSISCNTVYSYTYFRT
jgi:hypothetical protein